MVGKRYWTVVIKQALLVMALVFMSGFIFDRFTNDESYRNPVAAGFIAIVVYLAVTAIIGILHAISQILYLWLFSGRDMVESMLDDLRASKLPPPDDWQSKNFDYLEQLANDEDAETNDRVRAAVLFGGYNAAMAQGLFKALSLRMALDQAVLRYAQEAPKVRKPSALR